MWWIWIALLIEAVGLLLVWGLLLTAAPRSEKERCYEDEAQVRALANWRAGGGSRLIRRAACEMIKWCESWIKIYDRL